MTSVESKVPKLTGSQDLLSYFNLLPIYDRFVRPYSPPNRAAGLETSLFPYLSNLPGVVDIEPDNYLMNLLHDPQVHESGPAIRPLDQDTLKDAFSLKLGPVPGFDSSMLGMDDGNGPSAPAPASQDRHISLTLTTSETPTENNGERKHKKKKKKRKHSHENEEEGHSHSEHKKKKKRKKDREHERRRDESDSLIID